MKKQDMWKENYHKLSGRKEVYVPKVLKEMLSSA